MVQFRSCAAWSDQDTKESVDEMLMEIMDVEKYDHEEAEANRATLCYRIRNTKNND